MKKIVNVLKHILIAPLFIFIVIGFILKFLGHNLTGIGHLLMFNKHTAFECFRDSIGNSVDLRDAL